MMHKTRFLILSFTAICSVAFGGESRRPYEIAIEAQRMDIPAPHGFGERGAVVEDLDGDGIQDLAISGWRSQPLIMVVGSSAANHTPHFKQALLIPFPGANNATRGAMAYCRATPRRPALLVHMMESGRTDVFAGWPIQAKASYSTRFTVAAAVCADVDVDGSPELVVAEYTGSEAVLNAYNPMTGALLWNVPGVGGNGILAAQLDADLPLELVSNRNVIDGATRLEEWSYTPGFGSFLVAGQLDGDRTKEFLTAELGGTVTAFDSNPYATAWNLSASGGAGGLALGEIVGGTPDEPVVAHRQGQLTIYDAITRQPIRSVPAPAGSGGAWYPHIGDFDGNSVADIGWASGNGTSGPDALVLTEGATGATLAQWLTDPGPFWTTAAFEPTLGAAPVRIIAGEIEPGSGPGSILRRVDADLRLQLTTQLSNFSVRDLLVAQINPDVEPEVVLGGNATFGGGVQVRKAGSHALIWSANTNVQAFDQRTIKRVGIADWDGIAPLDVFALAEPRSTGASGSKIVVFRGSDGQLLWESPELGTGFAKINDFDIANVDADTSPELLLATGDSCWAIDIASRATDWSFPCTADVVQHYISETGALQLMTFALNGTIEFRQLPGFNVVRSLSTQQQLRAVAAVPGLPTILLLARDSGVVAIDAQSGKVLTPVPVQLGGFAGLRNRVEVVPIDNLNATITIASGAGLFTLRLSDDGIYRDGFENPE